MLFLIAAVILYARGGSLLPRSAAERPVYSIWIAYFLTLATINSFAEFSGGTPYDMFVVASALSGFGFMAMAGHVWGGSAIFGWAYHRNDFALSSYYSPILLGFMWLISMSSLAIHYNRRDKQQEDTLSDGKH